MVNGMEIIEKRREGVEEEVFVTYNTNISFHNCSSNIISNQDEVCDVIPKSKSPSSYPSDYCSNLPL